MIPACLANRSWLLVPAFFVLVICVWVTFYRLAGDYHTKRLTPAEEAEVLRTGVAP